MESKMIPCTCNTDVPCARAARIDLLRREVEGMHVDYLGHGLTRNVYANPIYSDWVLKLPVDCFYAIANEIEYDIAQRGEFGVPALRLEYVDGIPVVHMERVELLEGNEKWRAKDANKWTYDLGDGCQIGKTKDGRIVAYDLGHEDGWDPYNNQIFAKEQ